MTFGSYWVGPSLLEVIKSESVAADLGERGIVKDVVGDEEFASFILDPAGIAAVGEGAGV